MTLLSSGGLFLLISLSVAAVGVVLAWSSDRVGEAFRLERSMTGFVMLAAATSLPELIISCQVARAGLPDMAVGSLLGSCLFNLLILALVDMVRRPGGRLLTISATVHSIPALSSILLAAIVVLAVLIPGLPSLGVVHSASLLLLVVYVVTTRLVFVNQQAHSHAETASIDAAESIEPPMVSAQDDKAVASRFPTWIPIFGYLAATAAIFLLSRPLASTSENLAGLLGLSGTFFGAVFLAMVTSLPEVSTTYESARMGANDLAIGNILGSNTFNLMIIVAVDLVYDGPLFHSLDNVHVIAAIGVIVTTTVATMGILFRSDQKPRWYLEPGAIALSCCSLGFFYLIYLM